MINLTYAKKTGVLKKIENAIQVTPQDLNSPYKRYKVNIDDRYLEKAINEIIAFEKPEFIQYEIADGKHRGIVLTKEEIQRRLNKNV